MFSKLSIYINRAAFRFLCMCFLEHNVKNQDHCLAWARAQEIVSCQLQDAVPQCPAFWSLRSPSPCSPQHFNNAGCQETAPSPRIPDKWFPDKWKKINWSSFLKSNLFSVKCPHRLHWARLGFLQVHCWCQGQALSIADDWSGKSSAKLLYPEASSSTFSPDSIYSWLYFL